MDNIKAPSKGDRITADWAKRVTAAANRQHATPIPSLQSRFMRFESPSEYAFKVVSNTARDGFWICLPPGCLSCNGMEIDLAATLSLEKATTPNPATEDTPVPVDGRFDHVYNFAPTYGSINPTDTTTIYCAVIGEAEDETDETSTTSSSTNLPRAVFVTGSIDDSAYLQYGEAVVSKFRIATIIGSSSSGYTIEQVARGGVALGNGGGVGTIASTPKPFDIALTGSSGQYSSYLVKNAYCQIGGFMYWLREIDSAEYINAPNDSSEFVATLKVGATNTTSEEFYLATFASMSAMLSMQKTDLEFIYIPLYLFSYGAIVCDFRNMPNTGIVEFFSAQTSST